MVDHFETFRGAHPEIFLLEASNVGGLEGYLRSRGFLAPEGVVRSAAKAGDGNMNCTLRVAGSFGRVIVKQSRPWVEKYPQFAAPWDRALREADFYQRVAHLPGVAGAMPRLLGCDPGARLLVLEDLGEWGDYLDLHQGATLQKAELEAMARFLSALHQVARREGEPSPLANREMRRLNHAHMFVIPLSRDNGLDLDAITPGLSAAAGELQSDAAFVRETARLGREVYLADGRHLVHGDFFPGSLLRTPEGPKVIDPEFCHFGRPELDVATFLAHLHLGGQNSEVIEGWRPACQEQAGFDDSLMIQLAGVEIMRRLIGYAQLPLRHGLEAKRRLLELARKMVLKPAPLPHSS